MAAGVAQGPAGLQATTGVSQGQDPVACGVTGDHSRAVAGTIPPPTTGRGQDWEGHSTDEVSLGQVSPCPELQKLVAGFEAPVFLTSKSMYLLNDQPT